MNEVRNGEQKEHKYLYFEFFYGGQKLHKYFRSLLIKDTSRLKAGVCYVWSYVRLILEYAYCESGRREIYVTLIVVNA